jgi:glycosyltransferase involved in cell wall biosynthesis
MKEYVVPGVNGYVVPTGSVEALAAAIEDIRAKPLVGSIIGMPA